MLTSIGLHIVGLRREIFAENTISVKTGLYYETWFKFYFGWIGIYCSVREESRSSSGKRGESKLTTAGKKEN